MPITLLFFASFVGPQSEIVCSVFASLLNQDSSGAGLGFLMFLPITQGQLNALNLPNSYELVDNQDLCLFLVRAHDVRAFASS